MGMFDSFYDETGREWQTKAFGRSLEIWRPGDRFETEGPQTFQVEVLGYADQGVGRRDFRHSFATIRDGFVAAVDVPRDDRLPLFGYGGGIEPGAEVADVTTGGK